MTTPTQVPDELIAGDTWTWERELSDYPAGTYSGVWYFEKEDYNFSVTAGADGTKHTATVTASASAAYRAGRYRWRFVVTSGSTRKSPAEEVGWLSVQPNPAIAGNVDYRTTAKIVLDMIDTYLRDSSNLTAASYSLGGRSLSRWPRTDLLAERSKWVAEVAAEQRREKLAAGVGVGRIQVRF